ncbi:MAG TPA: T9SS type A sorting domain-containing protein, partial [Chitinophagales bacterium]|nr:T9SS type A sorting domain-containing protein [Chitinophagales bacterium]
AAGTTVFCEGSSVVLQGSAAASYLWTNGETTQNITVTQPGNYALTIQGTCAAFTSDTITIAPIPSHISSVVSVSVCDNSSQALSLEAYGSGSVYWYDNATGGSLINTGAAYNTPLLTDTTVTYYVESRDSVLGISDNVGPEDNTFGSGNNYTSNQYSQVFSVYKALVLKAVTVFAQGAGNRIIQLRSGTGVLLQADTVNIPNGTSVVNLNFIIQPGTNYRLGIAGANVNLYRNSSGANYPYTIPGLISITGNTANDPARWYLYYNWQVEELPIACTSTRVPVTAAVNPVPDATVTTSQNTTICAGDSVALTASAGTGYSYAWSNNANTPEITVSASGTFTVTVTDGNCSAVSNPVSVTVSNNATADVTASAATTFCAGDSVQLTTTAGTSYLWSNGATTQTVTVKQTETLTVTVTLTGNCSAISAPTAVVVNDLPTPSIAGVNTQYYSDDAPVSLTGLPAGGTFTGPGVSQNTFTPVIAGVGGPYTITYEYTDINGCSATATVDVTVLEPTGIATLTGVSNVTVFPNPNSGHFQLSLTGEGDQQLDVAIYNTLGQNVYEYKKLTFTGSYILPINLTSIAAGVYQLAITSGSNPVTYKLVVE